MIITKIEEATEVAQQLIDELYRSDSAHVAFEQVGILNGQEVVVDFIKHGEWGLAVEHLLYMIHESNICFPRELLAELHDIAASHGLVNYYSKKI